MTAAGPNRMVENKVLDKEIIISDGKKFAWTIPISFPISRSEAEKLEIGESVIVRKSDNEVIGILEISDIFPFDKKRYNQLV